MDRRGNSKGGKSKNKRKAAKKKVSRNSVTTSNYEHSQEDHDSSTPTNTTPESSSDTTPTSSPGHKQHVIKGNKPDSVNLGSWCIATQGTAGTCQGLIRRNPGLNSSPTSPTIQGRYVKRTSPITNQPTIQSAVYVRTGTGENNPNPPARLDTAVTTVPVVDRLSRLNLNTEQQRSSANKSARAGAGGGSAPTTSAPSNQKKDDPKRPTRSETSPQRPAERFYVEHSPLRVTKSDPSSTGRRAPHPQGAYPKTKPLGTAGPCGCGASPPSAAPVPAVGASNTRSYPPPAVHRGDRMRRGVEARNMDDFTAVTTFPRRASTSSKSPASPPTPANAARSSLNRPLTAASRMNLQRQEEHEKKRRRHDTRRQNCNKVGRTLQKLEDSLPEKFKPTEKSRAAIMQQTANYTKLLEDMLVNAPATSMCLVCDKPRIACGCEVPDFLRQPAERVGRKLEEYRMEKHADFYVKRQMAEYLRAKREGKQPEEYTYFGKQMCEDGVERPKFRLRVYEEEVDESEYEDENEDEDEGEGGEDEEGGEEEEEEDEGNGEGEEVAKEVKGEGKNGKGRKGESVKEANAKKKDEKVEVDKNRTQKNDKNGNSDNKNKNGSKKDKKRGNKRS